MAVTKAPTVKIKAPPAPKAPPIASKTQDNLSHHTSPVKGPQAVPEEARESASKSKVTLRKLPDVPKAKYKHDDNDG